MSLIVLSILCGFTTARMRLLTAICLATFAYAVMLLTAIFISDTNNVSLAAMCITSILAFNFGLLLSFFGALIFRTRKQRHAR